MADLTPIKLLEYLEPIDGEPQAIYIGSFMVKNFTKPKSLNHYAKNDSEPGKMMLLDLLDNKLIEADRERIMHICNKKWTNPEGLKQYQQWFDTYPIEAKITPKGLDKLNRNRLLSLLVEETNKSTRETTDIVRRNVIAQIILGIVSALAITATAIYAVKAYYKDDPENLILIRKSMQQQEEILKSIQQSQKAIDTSLKTMAKKTLPKK